MGVIFSHLLDGRIQKLYIWWHHANFALYQISLSSWEGARRKNFIPPVAGNTFQNIRCQLWWNFGSLPSPCTTWSWKYVVDKLNNSFTVSGHFVFADKLSFTGPECCLRSHLHDESKIWNNANLYNTVSVCLRVN